MPLSEYIKEALKESYKDSFKTRRDRIDIIADILSVTLKGAKKTQIVDTANLNFTRVEEYLPLLMDKELITNMDREYKTTEKGRDFLRDYQAMNWLLK